MIIKKTYFSEHEAAIILNQLLSAIAYCHSKSVVHRDIKPENLLLEAKEGLNIKIIDFGTAQAIDPAQIMTKKSGTPYYIAPEVLQKSYNSKCDVWSAGIVLYILLCGYPPFNGKDDTEIMKNVIKGKYSFLGNNWLNISKEAKDLISKMLCYNAKDRISALDALNHVWLKSYKEIDYKILNSKAALESLTQLRKFKAGEKLKQVAMTFIVSQLTKEKDKKDLQALFKAMDENGDGVLSKQEMLDGYRKVFGETFDEEQVSEIFKKVDTDDNGCIDYHEFLLASMKDESIFSKQNLKEAFNYLDKDGSGEISLDEIKAVLNETKVISDEAWHKIITEVDKNGDGVISFDEFLLVMQKVSS
jgi:calcium-dependent protein kinase